MCKLQTDNRNEKSQASLLGTVVDEENDEETKTAITTKMTSLLDAAEKIEVHTLESKEEQKKLYDEYKECLDEARALVTEHKEGAGKLVKVWQSKISSAQRTVNLNMMVLRHKRQQGRPSARKCRSSY